MSSGTACSEQAEQQLRRREAELGRERRGGAAEHGGLRARARTASPAIDEADRQRAGELVDPAPQAGVPFGDLRERRAGDEARDAGEPCSASTSQLRKSTSRSRRPLAGLLGPAK